MISSISSGLSRINSGFSSGLSKLTNWSKGVFGSLGDFKFTAFFKKPDAGKTGENNTNKRSAHDFVYQCGASEEDD
jgi:hypothetical protein